MKKLLIITIILFSAMPLIAEIDCEKQTTIFISGDKPRTETYKTELSEEEKAFCGKLQIEKERTKEIKRAKIKLNKAFGEKARLEMILPMLKKYQEIDKEIAKIESKYGFLDEDFYLILYGIGHALKEINQTEIINELAISLGNLKGSLVDNGYSEEQAMQIITAMLGTKIIPVDL